MAEKNGFVFYQTFLEAADILEPKDRLEFYDALLHYGVYGEVYEGDNILVKALLVQATMNIDLAKNRYLSAKENGGEGGRPREIDYSRVAQLRKEGLTQKQIAETLGCSERQIGRILKKQSEWKPQSDKSDKTDIIDKTRHNLNIKDNVNINVNDKVNANVKVKEDGICSLRSLSSSLPASDDRYNF